MEAACEKNLRGMDFFRKFALTLYINRMKVLKFGGTSVGTPDSLNNVRAIVESQVERCVITVSALGGITDRLIAAADMAAAGGDSWVEIYTEICQRHSKVCDAVASPDKVGEAWESVKALLDELETILKAINLLGEITERTRDLVVSYGERMSCIIVTAMIPGAELAHSLDFIRTRSHFGKNVLDSETTAELIASRFDELKNAKTIIVPGFIARNGEGRISNLGRGGSDYTAAILAAELDAHVLEIWTDVDGFMTADPRIVGDAHVIDSLSFVEAMELCNFGAKVVYPPTIYPVFHKNIPIIIKNTFNPEAAGTLIGDVKESAGTITTLGVSSIADTRLIVLRGADSELYGRMINTLTRNGIETLLPDGKESCGVRGNDAGRAKALLDEEFAGESATDAISISEHLATIALIGRGGSNGNTVEQMAKALNSAGIPIAQAPQQVSAGSVACMIAAGDLKEALQTIHSNFINTTTNR